MKVGFLGAGQLAQAIGGALIEAGHEIVLTNSRGPETLTDLVDQMGPGCTATTADRLKDETDVVILAVRWWQREDALTPLPDWDGAIVVDTLNNRNGPKPEDVIDIGDATSSELVAQLLPGARMVKALNHARIPRMAAPDGGVLFYCGDDAGAKAVVASLLSDIGGTPIDTGTLEEGAAMQNAGQRLSTGDRLLSADEAHDLIESLRQDRTP